MRKNINLAVALLAAAIPFALAPALAHASLQLPSYAAGTDVMAQATSTGKKITDLASLIVAIIAIICIIVSGVFFSQGNAETGKRYLVGSLIGLFVAGCAAGIAQLAL
jgi:hypothetical protein